jgi:SAM-dependent methyltransferase
MSDRSSDRPVPPEAPVADQPLPLSVWHTAQQPASAQRTGWYVPGSTAHPAKMLPAIARRTIAAYSQPGELVLDPMCGIGTTLVEATRLGRDAVGVELEPRWADLARANLAHARAAGATGTGRVVTGDARRLLKLVGPELTGRVAVVVTSPPYGSSVHGQVDARPGRGVVKYDNAYSADRANLGRVGQQALVAALAEILAGCHQLLRPGGLLVLTARPWRRREQLVDFPGQLTRTAEQPAWCRLNATWRCWSASTATGWLGDRRSSSWTGSARPARAACRCASSPTRTCWCSGGQGPPPRTEDGSADERPRSRSVGIEGHNSG